MLMKIDIHKASDNTFRITTDSTTSFLTSSEAAIAHLDSLVDDVTLAVKEAKREYFPDAEQKEPLQEALKRFERKVALLESIIVKV